MAPVKIRAAVSAAKRPVSIESSSSFLIGPASELSVSVGQDDAASVSVAGWIGEGSPPHEAKTRASKAPSAGHRQKTAGRGDEISPGMIMSREIPQAAP